MADEILSNGPMMFKTVEYTGDIEAGEGLEFDGNVLNVVGKQDTLTFEYDSDNAITSIDGHAIKQPEPSGSSETVLFIDDNPSTSTRSYTLSEVSTNFEYLKVFYKHVDGGNFISFFPGDSNTWVCNSFITGDQGLWLAATSYTSTDYLTFTLWRNWNFGFTPSTQRENARKHLVSKVVGINRKEGV